MWTCLASSSMPSWWRLMACSWMLGLLGMVTASVPDLPFGDINIMVVTDVHSFISGHPHEVDRNADYGDVLSFYQHVKEHCDRENQDLWFVMNGDWVHGTGLAMDGNATQLVPLLKQMPWDAVNLGNHEAYKSAIVELMRDDMIPHFGDAFLTSNTLDAATQEPLGNRFRVLEGKQHSVLMFGFLYDLPNPSGLLEVEAVEKAVKSDWFMVALKENEYDAIIVLAHMDNDDPLLDVILKRIREYTEETMPVQFLTGHTHERKFRKMEKDVYARAMEAGGFLDTVGWISLPSLETISAVRKGEVGSLTKHEFLNASKAVLRKRSGSSGDGDTWRTQDGQALSDQIQETRALLQLDEIVACPPRNYFLNRSDMDEDSVYKLWKDHIVPTQVLPRGKDAAMLISSDSFRYDVRGSGGNEKSNADPDADAMTLDDIIAVVPYMEPVILVGEVPERVIRRMNISLNTYSLQWFKPVPDYLLVGEFDDYGDPNKPYELYTHEFNLPEIMNDLDRLYEHSLTPTRTGQKDTLYWLNYAEQAWQCTHHKEVKQVKPWFSDIKELDAEESDGIRDSENADVELEKDLAQALDQESHSDTTGKGKKKKKKKNDLHYKGYEGYVAPSAIDTFGELLPPGMAPTAGEKPKAPAPTPAPGTKKVRHKSAADLAAIKARRKRIRRTTFKVLGILVAVALLLIPVYGMYGVLFSNNTGNDMEDEIFYDMKEMRALKRRKNGKRSGAGHKAIMMPSEIEIT